MGGGTMWCLPDDLPDLPVKRGGRREDPAGRSFGAGERLWLARDGALTEVRVLEAGKRSRVQMPDGTEAREDSRRLYVDVTDAALWAIGMI